MHRTEDLPAVTTGRAVAITRMSRCGRPRPAAGRSLPAGPDPRAAIVTGPSTAQNAAVAQHAPAAYDAAEQSPTVGVASSTTGSESESAALDSKYSS